MPDIGCGYVSSLSSSLHEHYSSLGHHSSVRTTCYHPPSFYKRIIGSIQWPVSTPKIAELSPVEGRPTNSIRSSTHAAASYRQPNFTPAQDVLQRQRAPRTNISRFIWQEHVLSHREVYSVQNNNMLNLTSIFSTGP